MLEMDLQLKHWLMQKENIIHKDDVPENAHLCPIAS